MIREAVLGDEKQIAKLGKNFFKEAGWCDITVWDHDKAETTLRGLINNSLSIILVVSNDDTNEIEGMIGVILSEVWFSGDTIAQELFWYMKPDKRNGVGHKLLKQLEKTAKERGADIVTMISLDKTKHLGKYFERNGYRPSENNYIRKL